MKELQFTHNASDNSHISEEIQFNINGEEILCQFYIKEIVSNILYEIKILHKNDCAELIDNNIKSIDMAKFRINELINTLIDNNEVINYIHYAQDGCNTIH